METQLSLIIGTLISFALMILLWPVLKKQAGSASPLKVIVPVFLLMSFGLYLFIGSPQHAFISTHKPKPQEITLVEKLEAKLEKEPNNPAGWLLLARSYFTTDQYLKAILAYEEVIKREPKNVTALLGLADAIGMSLGGDLRQRPYTLIQKALALEPENTLALTMAASAEMQKGKKNLAIQHWQKIIELLPPESKQRQGAENLIKKYSTP